MKLFIRNMVCNRCTMAVTQVFESLGLRPVSVNLGEVVLSEESLPEPTLKQLDEKLVALGFERIDDRRGRMVEAIKKKVITTIHSQGASDRKFNWSSVLSDELHYDYNYLSNLFSSMEGITLEQYIIRQKIERVKELLFYDELTLSQIAHQLGYSSVAHLSSQFKKVTGLTPSELKKSRSPQQVRKALDDV